MDHHESAAVLVRLNLSLDMTIDAAGPVDKQDFCPCRGSRSREVLMWSANAVWLDEGLWLSSLARGGRGQRQRSSTHLFVILLLVQDYDLHLVVYLLVLLSILVVNNLNLLMREAILWKLLLILRKWHILQLSISLVARRGDLMNDVEDFDL